jgi:hypothetical protein
LTGLFQRNERVFHRDETLFHTVPKHNLFAGHPKAMRDQLAKGVSRQLKAIGVGIVRERS